MIFVAAGTQDGRELTAYLLSQGFAVAVSVVSDYGKILLPIHENLSVNAAPLDETGLRLYLTTHKIRAVVDASHPYAAQISATAMKICRELNLPYIRYERPAEPLDYERIIHAPDYSTAANLAAQYADAVFLTTGSRSLPIFCRHPSLQNRRLIARVLPTAKVLKECEALGLKPKDIVALQGPFSVALNEELFRAYDASVVITKEAGRIGGVDTKVTAAKNLSLPVIVIDRPHLDYDCVATDFAAVAEFLKGI